MVPVEDSKAMAEAMDLIASKPALRTQLIYEGAKRANDFRVKKITQDYEELFQQQVEV